MVRCLAIVLGLSACGRFGFDGSEPPVDAIQGGDAGVSTIDAPPLLGSVTCSVVRTPIAADAVEVIAEAAPMPLIVWRTASGQASMGLLAADDTLTNITPLFSAGTTTRLVGVHPIANGHALAVDTPDGEALYRVAPDLSGVVLRAMAEPGIGRGNLASFGGQTYWGHVVLGSPRAIFVERLDADGVPTPQANRTTATDVRDIIVNGANSGHAHFVWSEANDTCVASELFSGVPDLADVHTIAGCRSPRNAAGVEDSIATAYETPSGALRFYTLSPSYEHDVELSPSGRAPALADDGTVVWATWRDDRAGGALVLAKIEPTTAALTVKQLGGVTPANVDGVTLVGDASPARLLVLEAGMLAVVRPCL